MSALSHPRKKTRRIPPRQGEPREACRPGRIQSLQKNSSPLLGQVRCGCVFMGLTALRPQSWPKRCTTLCRVVPNRRERIPANGCSVPGAIACSFILARQITCRNKIVLPCPVLITTFNKAGGSKLTAVSHNPAVRRTDTRSQSKRAQPELRSVKKDICTQSRNIAVGQDFSERPSAALLISCQPSGRILA